MEDRGSEVQVAGCLSVGPGAAPMNRDFARLKISQSSRFLGIILLTEGVLRVNVDLRYLDRKIQMINMT